MWIKICGNTNLEDAQLAADAGANAVGFVFAESPRRVTRERVRAITPHLPKAIEKYGVFVNPSLDEVIETVEVCRLTGVQLQSYVRSGSGVAPARAFCGGSGTRTAGDFAGDALRVRL